MRTALEVRGVKRKVMEQTLSLEKEARTRIWDWQEGGKAPFIYQDSTKIVA